LCRLYAFVLCFRRFQYPNKILFVTFSVITVINVESILMMSGLQITSIHGKWFAYVRDLELWHIRFYITTNMTANTHDISFVFHNDY
jgi:hypothetical protein